MMGHSVLSREFRGHDTEFWRIRVMSPEFLEVDHPALPVLIVRNDVIAEIQDIAELLFHILSRAPPLAHLHGKLAERLADRHLLPELDPMRKPKGQQQHNHRRNKLRLPQGIPAFFPLPQPLPRGEGRV
jgi:hypothetical protein